MPRVYIPIKDANGNTPRMMKISHNGAIHKKLLKIYGKQQFPEHIIK